MKDMTKFLKELQNLHTLKSQIKGSLGELVFEELARTYLSNSYHIFSNVVLRVKKNDTTQIDQIIISKFGIFIVELKNFQGWIFGDSKNNTWTQVLHGKKYYFQNPLHQNYKHLKTLESLLNLPKSKLFSLVVFSANVNLKTQLPPNVVVGGEAYLNFITQHQIIILSDAEVHESTVKILDNRLTNKDHQVNIDKKQEQYHKATFGEKPDCPKCGRVMIRRTARKGSRIGKEFWGCSGYPKCKTIINIDKEQEQIVNAMQTIFNSIKKI